MSHRLAKKLRRKAKEFFGIDGWNKIPQMRQIHQKAKSEASERKKQGAKAPAVGKGPNP